MKFAGDAKKKGERGGHGRGGFIPSKKGVEGRVLGSEQKGGLEHVRASKFDYARRETHFAKQKSGEKGKSKTQTKSIYPGRLEKL